MTYYAQDPAEFIEDAYWHLFDAGQYRAADKMKETLERVELAQELEDDDAKMADKLADAEDRIADLERALADIREACLDNQSDDVRVLEDKIEAMIRGLL